jgi:hypothetical protein
MVLTADIFDVGDPFSYWYYLIDQFPNKDLIAGNPNCNEILL